MCGIVGIVGTSSTQERVIEGLASLEYRGYDSAGIAVINDHDAIECRRAVGKLQNLKTHLNEDGVDGHIGIGHTRWATHGTPTIENTHPHATDNVALVHNGIIENFQSIKNELIKNGVKFISETDTEVVTRLLDQQLREGKSPLEATFATLRRLKGAYALAIVFKNHKDLMIGARKGSPLALGYGEGEHYLGSDRMALAHLTDRISYLEEGDVAVLSSSSVTIYDHKGDVAQRAIHTTGEAAQAVSKGPYPHFMLKEIYEQPDALQQTLSQYLTQDHQGLSLPDLAIDAANISRITIIACGTAYYAGVVAKYWLEQIARIPVEVDIASEFRYRQGPMPKNGVAIFISQSGETADTLAAFEYAKSCDQHTLGVINVPESSLARGVDQVFYTHAGPEIGVASTKAFTTQLAVLLALSLKLAAQRGQISADELKKHCHSMSKIPASVMTALKLDSDLLEVARSIKSSRDVLFLGRGTSYPIALEGALKLKEISYIHAEAYAAGEMKHGPIALIDEEVPVVILAPEDELFEKTISNMQEVASRNGRVILFSNSQAEQSSDITKVDMPTVDHLILPIIYTIPMQLLAYHTATLKGTDVDQPRNLAKSVTVE